MVRLSTLVVGLAVLAGCHGNPAPIPAPVAVAIPEPAPEIGAPPAVQPTPVLTAVHPACPIDGQPIAPKHVVIISEDGLRPDVLSEELTPVHMQLMREGTKARIARTITDSDTLPSHASMLSGFGEHEHGMWWNSYHPGRGYIHVPTVFSVAKEHGLTTAMFVGKPKLRHLALPGSVDHFERPSYFCAGVAKAASAYFIAEKPSLMFVHFSDPDEFGHSDGWMSPAYLKGVKNSDGCLGVVLAAIHDSGLGDETLIIVTADHGGHGKSHSGSAKEIDQEIPWIAMGPGIGRDATLDVDVNTVDTAATVLSALRLPMPLNIVGLPRFVFTN